MKYFWRFPIALGLTIFSAVSMRSAESVDGLRKKLEHHIAQPRFSGALWGIRIVSLDSGATLFEHNSTKLLKPASNAKLFTAAMALDTLGTNFSVRTSFYSRSGLDAEGTVKGDLIVYGRGDFSHAARFSGNSYLLPLEDVSGALVLGGIKRVTGDLVADERYFTGPPLGSGWMWDDLQFYYGAEVSGLNLYDNVVDLMIKPARKENDACNIVQFPTNSYLTVVNRTKTGPKGGPRQIQVYRPLSENTVYVTGQLPLGGSPWQDAAAIHEPGLWYLNLLRGRLQERGIQVDGKIRAITWLDDQPMPDYDQIPELANLRSKPLTALLTEMMKSSQNLYAHLLFLQVGKYFSFKGGKKFPTTEDYAQDALKGFVKTAGIRPEEVLLEEGSGLSRAALVTPNAIVQLLKHMARHPAAEPFRNALPVAGVDGSLRTRLKDPPAKGNVRAKTGTIRYVNCLSGYVTTASQEHLAFSLMLNNYLPPEGPSARNDLDVVAQMLAAFDGSTAGTIPKGEGSQPAAKALP